MSKPNLEGVRVLSVRQPWAWAIVTGQKRIENRTWRTAYRGPLLIHAGVSHAALGHYGKGEPPPTRLTFGAVIGRVELVDCVPLAELPSGFKGDRHAEGPWCWLLANPVELATPFACPGAVGLFLPPAGFEWTG